MDRIDNLGRQLIDKIKEDGPTPKCYQPEEFEAYISDEMPSDKRQTMDAHIEECLYCLKEMVEIRHLLKSFHDTSVPDPILRAELEKVLEKGTAQQSRAAIIPVPQKSVRWWNSFGWSLGGAFAGALITILMVNYSASEKDNILLQAKEDRIRLMGGSLSKNLKEFTQPQLKGPIIKKMPRLPSDSLREVLVTSNLDAAKKELKRLKELGRAFIVLAKDPKDGSQIFRVVAEFPQKPRN